MTYDAHALSGAYALDALDADERAAFEEHLAGCADCAREVAELRATAAELARLAEAEPPAELRARVLAGPHAATNAGAPGVPRRRAWPVLAAAAALVVVAGLGGWLWHGHGSDGPVPAAAVEQMREIAAAPDAVSHAFPAFGDSHVVMSGAMSKAAIVGEDVPMPAGEGMAYQVFMVHEDGSVVPGPTFMPEHGEVVVIVDGDLSAVARLAVTVEPMTGSTRPTGPMTMTVEL